MNTYSIIWEIEIDADSPKEAAKKALEIQRDPESIALVFKVCEIKRTKLSYEEIDLHEEILSQNDAIQELQTMDLMDLNWDPTEIPNIQDLRLKAYCDTELWFTDRDEKTNYFIYRTGDNKGMIIKVCCKTNDIYKEPFWKFPK